MTNQTSRTTGTLRAVARPSSAVAAAVLLAGGLALGGCSKDVPASSGAPAGAAAQADASAGDASTADLVDAALTTPAAATTATTATTGGAPLGAARRGLRARLLRALHATWVTESKNGPVTHQAIRGEVTAVSGTSVTVKAKDGVSMTFAVTGDTRVRARANGKGTDSTASAIRVGDKAFVAGVGATNPQARVVVFRSGTATTPATPAPSTTS